MWNILFSWILKLCRKCYLLSLWRNLFFNYFFYVLRLSFSPFLSSLPILILFLFKFIITFTLIVVTHTHSQIHRYWNFFLDFFPFMETSCFPAQYILVTVSPPPSLPGSSLLLLFQSTSLLSLTRKSTGN